MAFFDCKELREVYIHGTIGSTGIRMFQGCIKLRTVSLSVVRLEDYTFLRCRRLSELNIDKNIKYIGKLALNTIGINEFKAEGVEIIDEGAFSRCDNLTRVELKGENLTIMSNSFDTCNFLETIVLDYKSINLVTRGMTELRHSIKTDILIPKDCKTNLYTDNRFNIKVFNSEDIQLGVNKHNKEVQTKLSINT